MLFISELFVVQDIDLDITDYLCDNTEKPKILDSMDTLFVTISAILLFPISHFIHSSLIWLQL